jgi:hypothetical protein
MIHHLVFWKCKEQALGRSAQENAALATQKLNALRGVVPALSLAVGVNTLPGSEYDLALTSSFESQAALDAYQGHPEHLKVVAFIREIVEKRSAVDFEG